MTHEIMITGIGLWKEPYEPMSCPIKHPKIGMMNCLTNLALTITEKAIKDARFTLNRSVRMGVILGTWFGSQAVNEAFLKGEGTASMFVLGTANAISGVTAIEHQCEGPNMTLLGCTSGLKAISIAADYIRQGKSDVMLAGGIDDPTPFASEILDSSGELAIKPTLKPGAAVFLLERESDCCIREARLNRLLRKGRIQPHSSKDGYDKRKIIASSMNQTYYLAADAPIMLADFLNDEKAGFHAVVIAYGLGEPETYLEVDRI